jgi:hypothetical protein
LKPADQLSNNFCQPKRAFKAHHNPDGLAKNSHQVRLKKKTKKPTMWFYSTED